MTTNLTQGQADAIRRATQNGGREYFSPDMAKQLVKLGLVELTGEKYRRYEYNRPVKGSTLWQIRIK